MDVWSHEERSNQKRICERISNRGTRVKGDHKKRLESYGHVKRRDEGHVIRRMSQERDGEEDRKPGGKTRVKVIWKVWGERRRKHPTDQRGRDIQNHSGDPRWWEKPEEKKEGCRTCRGPSTGETPPASSRLVSGRRRNPNHLRQRIHQNVTSDCAFVIQSL